MGLETIKQSGERAAAVVSDLLTIARGIAVSKNVMDLNTIIREYACSPEHVSVSNTHSDISLVLELDDELLNIKGSAIHIKKVLMNLISNAMEAITGNGVVTVTSRNQYLDQSLRGYIDIQKGEYVVLCVSDNGPGIDRADLDRIFEPFYTRKVMGRSGTGLGLAVVWNIVRDHDASIHVVSNLQGTTFEIYFPAVREKVNNAADAYLDMCRSYERHMAFIKVE